MCGILHIMVSDSGYNFNGKNDCSERAKSDCKRQFISIIFFFFFFVVIGLNSVLVQTIGQYLLKEGQLLYSSQRNYFALNEL